MQNNESKTTNGQPPNSPEIWLLGAVPKLAAAWNELMPKERLDQYVEDLKEFTIEELSIGFLRARRELDKFPSIAQLRMMIRGETANSAKQRQTAEAYEAWEWVMEYVSRYGCDGLGEYRNGYLVPPPPISERTRYALARIGGLRAMRSIPEESFPFMLRDFTAAFNEFPLTELEDKPVLTTGAKQLMPSAEEIAEKGVPISLQEIGKQLIEIVRRMPDPTPEKLRTVDWGDMPPALELTKEQIEKRKVAERAEIERYRKQMEE